MSDEMVGAVAVFLMVLVLWALLSVIGVAFFMWAWNFFMPIVWHAAPHITFWQAFAAGVLLGALRAVVSVSGKK